MFVKRAKSLMRYSSSLASLGLSTLSQIAIFVALARILPLDEFGIYTTLTAIAAFSLQITGLSSTDVIVRGVAKDQSRVKPLLGQTLILIMLSFAPVFLGSLALTFAVYQGLAPSQFPWRAAAELILANAILFKFVSIPESLYLANGMVVRANLVLAAYSVLRAAIILAAIVWLDVKSFEDFAWLNLVFHIFSAVFALVLALWMAGMPRFVLAKDDIVFGVGITILRSSMAMLQNLDRIMLGALASPATVAIYGAAQRATSAGMIPVLAQLRSTYPRFFAAAQNSPQNLYALARTTMRNVTIIGIGTAFLLFILAPLLPLALGQNFAPSVGLLQALALMPLLSGIQNVFGDVLLATDHPMMRTVTGLSSAALGILTMAITVPRFGLTGIVIAVYCTSIFSVLTSGFAIQLMSGSLLTWRSGAAK